jgi:succinyl-diaminopimelate desuccinylase
MSTNPAALIDSTLVVELTRQLIRVNTVNPPGNESGAAQVLARVAAEVGLETTIQQIQAGRSNVVVRLPGSGGAPTLMYCGHIDTVPPGDLPWKHPPFDGAKAGGRVYGRGAADMKGGLAAMLVSLITLRRTKERFPGDILFVAFAGEAVDWLGSRYFLTQRGMDEVGWLVVGEPTNLDIVVGHRGVLWIEAKTIGRAAHGSSKSIAINAIAHMAELIHDLNEWQPAAPNRPLMPPPTSSVNTVSGGTRTNFIAGECTATLDVRTVPGLSDDDVLDSLQELASRVAVRCPDLQAEFRVIESHPPVQTDPAHPLIQAAVRASTLTFGAPKDVRAVGYYSDAAVLQAATGVPTLLFGPGDESLGHPVNESVAESALMSATDLLTRLPAEVFQTKT